MSTIDKRQWRSWLELFLLSFVSLFIELLIIRWMSTNIRAFSVFKTFPLIACFIGLGTGYALAKDEYFKTAPWAILLFAAVMQLAEMTGISMLPFPSLSIFYWHDLMTSSMGIWNHLGIFAFAMLFLVGAPFLLMLCIGARLGLLFNQFKPLPAYSVNIAGAIIGSLFFTWVSFCGLPPVILLAGSALIILYYSNFNADKFSLSKQALTNCLVVLAAIIFAASIAPVEQGAKTFWSPYQKLDLVPILTAKSAPNTKPVEIGKLLLTNQHPYQFTIDWQALNKNRNLLDEAQAGGSEIARRRFRLPFLSQKPEDVLIVGSGMGNDVAAALAANASSIDAVEIDPVILKLGIQYHPDHPYDSPKVHKICNDARNYFNHSKKHYDLVVFSHLDSHVVTAGSSLRIDNFVYTKESFRSAVNLLKPNGLVVVSFYSLKPWFGDRLYKTMHEAIGYEPLELSDKSCPVFITFIFGPAVANHSFVLPAEMTDKFSVVKEHPSKGIRLLTDDWPYLYVTPGIIDVPYLLIVAEMILLALIVGRKTLQLKVEPRRWQMFFLGAAFMLLELQAISRLSLLFGATWLTSAIVINGVLIMILAANFVVLKNTSILLARTKMLYLLLFITLLISYALPQFDNQYLLSLGQNGSAAVITLITLLPVLLASMIFAVSFSQVRSSKDALAMNLYGAFFGSMLEYCSNYIGINALVLIAVVLYLLSFISIPKVQAIKSEEGPVIS